MNSISIIGLGGMARALGTRVVESGHAVEVIGRDAAKPRSWPSHSETAPQPEYSALSQRATSSSWPCRVPAPQQSSLIMGTRWTAR